jgi:hypothetical protein
VEDADSEGKRDGEGEADACEHHGLLRAHYGYNQVSAGYVGEDGLEPSAPSLGHMQADYMSCRFV